MAGEPPRRGRHPLVDGARGARRAARPGGVRQDGAPGFCRGGRRLARAPLRGHCGAGTRGRTPIARARPAREHASTRARDAWRCMSSRATSAPGASTPPPVLSWLAKATEAAMRSGSRTAHTPGRHPDQPLPPQAKAGTYRAAASGRARPAVLDGRNVQAGLAMSCSPAERRRAGRRHGPCSVRGLLQDRRRRSLVTATVASVPSRGSRPARIG